MKETSYKNYLLAVLLVILAFNALERLTLGLVLQSIKLELHLSDTDLGLLGGIAFALFYSAMGLPIARWADRGNRVTIISMTVALWGAAMALCGLAGTFVQLLLVRVGVAVGEAGCIPPAHSLIADHFTRAERPRATARYMLGIPLSTIFGYSLAGWLNEIYGWRMTFMLLGLPGVALAILARLTLREPRIQRSISPGADSLQVPESSAETPAVKTAHPSLKDVYVTLWANATFRQLMLCFSIVAFFSFGMVQWKPAFFIRSYGLKTGELGTWFALTYGLGTLLGTYIGGEWASRYAAQNERLQLKVQAMVYCAVGVISVVMYLSPNASIAFVLMTIAAIGTGSVNGPLFATIQTLVPARMRAMSVALLYLFANLLGMGLGPLAAGALSDALRPMVGEESLRYALLVLCPGYAWGGWFLWRASRTVTCDVDEARSQQHANAEPNQSVSLSSSVESRRRYG